MNGSYTNLFFMVLNNSVYCALLFWFIKKHLLPAIRTSKAISDEVTQQVAGDIAHQRVALQGAHENQQRQKWEIARLTTALEKWTGVLSQRAATAEQEVRELSFRYKKRCEEDARARALQSAHQIVTKQVVKNVRALLVQEYADSAEQQRYFAMVSQKLTPKDQR